MAAHFSALNRITASAADTDHLSVDISGLFTCQEGYHRADIIKGCSEMMRWNGLFHHGQIFLPPGLFGSSKESVLATGSMQLQTMPSGPSSCETVRFRLMIADFAMP